MFRTFMLAGLMSATILSGVAPAYAQRSDNERSAWRAGDRAQQAQTRGNGQRRGDARPDRAPRDRAQTQAGQARNENRPVRTAVPQQRPQQPARVERPVAWQVQPGARRDQVQDRWDDRRDRPQNRQDQRPDRWSDRQNDRRDDVRRNDRDDRRDWRQDRRGDARDGRRYDDRTRWANQQRWDNRWRNDRRYDWSSYRARYGDRFRAGRYYAPRGWDYGYRSFSIGIFLSNMLYANDYWIDDPSYYRLPPSYGSLRWVRYYDDALLVDVRDGYVADVIRNFFW